MPLSGITGSVDTAAQAAALAANSTTKKSQTMDSEVFMQLLVTQLRNQDPSSPMDTNQMISQQTQLAMMEQVTNQTTTANENFSLQMRIAAANLVGKQVSYTDAASGSAVTGTATAVSYASSVPTVTVNGKEVDLDVISGITTA
ncbi:flagellar hook capping protein [Curtobacterium sp. C1]|uniref:Flagellar hook capping protein n=1 Tax=Curtobacterium citreum TaxID=2036 RepID=A0A850DVZ0_9MICO|nr:MULTISPECIES: flagellar hook capping FlgD N-terminal domain-containing protein [Curtobacterium]MCS5487755.1 flagellar hook capping protein [Curtobacterium flaccumfaciens pv. basellae]MCS6521057.1 flagellar hook capping protein [Curtobacterium citreum]MDK8172077.1 flagellar hook capping FlgD N-terminal domain-containing protein [Curtobacterium citreum]NUU29111.1 flagellar hook capping protein [Curtobacterium albidum]QKS14270.1 flagellar hook capping protein [Curtobacterium sp. csp3]